MGQVIAYFYYPYELITDTMIVYNDTDIVNIINKQYIKKGSQTILQTKGGYILIGCTNGHSWYMYDKSIGYINPFESAEKTLLIRRINDEKGTKLFITNHKKIIKIVNQSSQILSVYHMLDKNKLETSYLAKKTYGQYNSNKLEVYTSDGKLLDFIKVYENHCFNLGNNDENGIRIRYNESNDVFTITDSDQVITN
jgi:hypothetical protein